MQWSGIWKSIEKLKKIYIIELSKYLVSHRYFATDSEIQRMKESVLFVGARRWVRIVTKSGV